MERRNDDRPWSLWPEELLIESTRDYLAAHAALDDAMALDKDPTNPTTRPMAPLSVGAAMVRMRRLVALLRERQPTAPVVGDASGLDPHKLHIPIRFR